LRPMASGAPREKKGKGKVREEERKGEEEDSSKGWEVRWGEKMEVFLRPRRCAPREEALLEIDEWILHLD